MQVDTLDIFLLAALTAVATGLGAIPFLFSRSFSRRNLGLANPLAAGLMIAASLGLLYEGARTGLGLTALGGLIGVGFDHVEARFTGRVADPHAMAERLYKFCPDIVHQGTGSVAELASELRRLDTFFCWWD